MRVEGVRVAFLGSVQLWSDGIAGTPFAGGPLLPTALAIILAVLALGTLVAVAVTVWRLLASLKALMRSVAAMSEQLGPVLEELARQSEHATEQAARLQARRGGGGAGTAGAAR
jgi:hypothetical protein